MKKPKRPQRARTEARKAVRSAEKLTQARDELARLEPGGTPERPLEVVSASLVERRAEGLSCSRCHEGLRATEHIAEEHEGELLRVVDATCRACGKVRKVYFRIQPALAN